MNAEEIKLKTTPILKRHDVEFAGLFGSYARQEADSASDVDLVVRYSKPKGLEHVRLALELEDVLKKKVDLITERSVDKYLKPFIAKDLKIFYGQRQQL